MNSFQVINTQGQVAEAIADCVGTVVVVIGQFQFEVAAWNRSVNQVEAMVRIAALATNGEVEELSIEFKGCFQVLDADASME